MQIIKALPQSMPRLNDMSGDDKRTIPGHGERLGYRYGRIISVFDIRTLEQFVKNETKFFPLATSSATCFTRNTSA